MTFHEKYGVRKNISKTFTLYETSHVLLPIILAMPPQVFIGGQTIVLLNTVAKETHTTIPKIFDR